jgi:hypothetical protein
MTNASPARPIPASPARPVLMQSCDLIKGHTAGAIPCLDLSVTVAILGQGTNWAVAVTQAFFENGQQRFVILRDWRPTLLLLGP